MTVASVGERTGAAGSRYTVAQASELPRGCSSVTSTSTPMLLAQRSSAGRAGVRDEPETEHYAIGLAPSADDDGMAGL